MPEVTLEELASSVAALKDAVEHRSDDALDAEKVQRIVEETMERQRAAAVAANERNGNGFTPGDDEGGQPSRLPQARNARLTHVLNRSAASMAPLLGRSEDVVRHFQRRSDELVLLSTIMQVDPRETEFYATEFMPAVRAMDTQTSSEGTEWVPRELSASLIERVNLQLLVANLFPSIVMPTPTFDIPAKSVSRVRGGRLAEATADTGQAKARKVTPGTRKVTLTAVKFAIEALVSRDLEEDAVLAILPFIEEELIEGLAADQEDAILNGDTTATHMDADVTDADDPRKFYVGLRKSAAAGAKSDAGNDKLTVADLRVNRSKMGKYGVRPSGLAHILGIQNYIQLLDDTSVLTLDKYGPNATILAGELGKVDGSPIIVSEYMRNDLNATGVQDGVTTNRSTALTVYTPGFVRGERRGITTQLLKELYAESDQDAVLVTQRSAFASRFPATEKTVGQAYNLA